MKKTSVGDGYMRKRLILYVIIFTLIITGVKVLDIVYRYDIGIYDYLKYSMPLTPDEKDYLKRNKISYGIGINDAPFAFVSQNSVQNTGILVDYFNQLSVSLECEFRPVVYDKYNLAIKLKNGGMDCSVLNMNKINKSVFLFTQRLYTERSKVLVKGESKYSKISDVTGLSIAVVSGSTAHHEANIFFGNRKEVSLVLMRSLDDCFSAIENGEIDAIIGDEARISYKLNQALRSNRYKFLEGSIAEEDVAVAVNMEQELLFDILNKGILEMKKNNQYSHINSKWFGSFIPETDEFTEGVNTANILSLIILIFGGFFIWNKSVANEVSIKTRELKESRQELRNLVDSLSDGIAVTDYNRNILAANRKIADIIGMPITDLVGKNTEEITGLKPFLLHSNEPKAFSFGDKSYLVTITGVNESSSGRLIIIKDDTERQKHERLNRQEAKMIAVGELSAGLAHEIRNPLGLIKSYIYVLKKKIDNPAAEHAIEVMDDSVDRINHLIENLLGFSRLSRDEAVETDIIDSIKSIMELERKDIEKRNVTIEVDVSGVKYRKVKVHEDLLKLCMVNLTNNALDAFEGMDIADKKITIRAKTDESRLELEFTDNACGIPEDKLEDIFNPFFTTKDSGTGLGLYILQSELIETGGTISVRSKERAGTEFFVRFPIKRSDKPSSPGKS